MSFSALRAGVVHSLLVRSVAIDPDLTGLGVFLPGLPGALGGNGVSSGPPPGGRGPFGTQFFGVVVLRVLVRACACCCIGCLPSKEHSYVHALIITLRPCVGVAVSYTHLRAHET